MCRTHWGSITVTKWIPCSLGILFHHNVQFNTQDYSWRFSHTLSHSHSPSSKGCQNGRRMEQTSKTKCLGSFLIVSRVVRLCKAFWINQWTLLWGNRHEHLSPQSNAVAFLPCQRSPTNVKHGKSVSLNWITAISKQARELSFLNKQWIEMSSGIKVQMVSPLACWMFIIKRALP